MASMIMLAKQHLLKHVVSLLNHVSLETKTWCTTNGNFTKEASFLYWSCLFYSLNHVFRVQVRSNSLQVYPWNVPGRTAGRAHGASGPRKTSIKLSESSRKRTPSEATANKVCRQVLNNCPLEWLVRRVENTPRIHTYDEYKHVYIRTHVMHG